MSEATNLVPGDTPGYDVFVRDRQGRAGPSASALTPAGRNGRSQAATPAISPGGRYVVFGSGNPDTADIYLCDRLAADGPSWSAP